MLIRFKNLLLCAAVLLFSAPFAAMAAESAAQAASGPASTPKGSARVNLKRLQETPGSTQTNPSKPKCEAKAGTGGSSAVECSVAFKGVTHMLNNDQTKVQQGVFTFASLDLNIPQPKGSDSVTLGSLDGLAKSYTIGVTLGQTRALQERTLLYGLSLKGGPQSYTWYETPSLAKKSEHRSTSSVSGFLGTTFEQFGPSAIYVRYRQETTFKDSKSKILCPPAITSDPVECVNGPIGAPDRSRPRVLTLQWAHAFSEPGTGMSVSVSHDSRNHIKGVDIPIYLYTWRAEKSKLAFGIQASWTNDPTSAHKGSLAAILSTDAFQVLSAD